MKIIFQMMFHKEINTYLEHISEDRSQSLQVFKFKVKPHHTFTQHAPQSARKTAQRAAGWGQR